MDQIQAWFNRLMDIRNELSVLYITRLQCSEEYTVSHAEVSHANLIGSSDAVRKANVELALAKSPIVTAATMSLGRVEANIKCLEMQRDDIRLFMRCEIARLSRESDEVSYRVIE